MEISIQSIVVENRFRHDMGDVDALARSIAEIGLLQPVGVDVHRRLVYGGRRLEAVKQLGWKTIDARVINCDALLAERDENDMRKEFTVTERLAIAQKIAETLEGRNHRPEKSGNISLLLEAGQTRDLAAKAAGIGSGKTLEAAQKVVKQGVPKLVEAMDEGAVSIHTAAAISTLPAHEQQAIDYADKADVKRAGNRANDRRRKADKSSDRKEKPPKPDESRLYEEGASTSAFVAAVQAKTAISRISKKDPNSLTSIESIQEALNRQRDLITQWRTDNEA